ncbi:RHS repeat-associated core domain-containing protein [Porphyromonas sp.]
MGLAYNRFRYYSPELGRYISEDPIRFASGTLALHNYVEDSNSWLDVLGLTYKSKKQARMLILASRYSQSRRLPIIK